jgi:hypothetical protein
MDGRLTSPIHEIGCYDQVGGNDVMKSELEEIISWFLKMREASKDKLRSEHRRQPTT